MLSLLVIAVLSFLASSMPASAQAPRAERPTYAIGDKWILGAGVYDLIRIENDLYVFAAESGSEIHLSRDLSLAKAQRRDGAAIEFIPPPRVAWPLEVGKSSSSFGNWTTPRGRGTIYITWKVEAYEDVTVPAGTFKAFRVTYSWQAGPAREWMGYSTWYAPEVRQIVKVDGGESLRVLNWQVVAIDRHESAPLQLALRQPKDQVRVATEQIVLLGKATAGKGVTQLAVTVNGAEISRQEEKGAPKDEVALDLPVKLTEGRNVLIVTAVDATGQTRQEARTLFYEKAAPTPAPPAVIAKPAAPQAEEALKRRLEEERRKAEELARLEQEKRKKSEELAKSEQLKRQQEEQARNRAEEQRKQAEELARLEQEKRKKAEQVASLPPMQVAISSPRDQARLENDSVALAGLVSGGKGVSRVMVALNGIELSRLEEKAPQRSVAVNLPVKLRDGQNTLVVTASDVDGTIQQEVRTVYYEKPAPLSIAFRYPEDRSKVNEDATLVAAVVTSSKGVSKVSVTLNGTEVHQQSERSPQRSLALTVPLKLKEGVNAVVLNASEPDGNLRQEIRTVIYEPAKGIEAVAKVESEKTIVRDLWAVVVGVGRYQSLEIPRLRYTVSDAESLYEVLVNQAGFKKEHVLLLTDQTEKKPTLRNVKWALGTFLARSAKKNDTVVIFFAGHGAPEVDQSGVERDGLAKYLIPNDAEPDDLYSTALPMDELQTIFGRLEAERVVAFLDACYSGAAGGRTFSSQKTRAGHVDDLFLERLTRSKGRAIITASRPSEVSIELPELGHGIFTYYLVQGLKGAADLNRDGIVTLQELYEYVEQQVTQKSRAVGGNQHPVMKGEMEGVLPMVKVAGK